MATNNTTSLISIGELAKMFNMSKQTINYYSKTDILPPEETSDSGYRYYAKKQFTNLEMILILRKLNIPLTDIRDFIKNKASSAIIPLLEKKLQKSLIQLEKQKQLIASLEATLANLKNQSAVPPGCFQTQQLPAVALKISHPLGKTTSQKYFPEYIRHNQKMFSSTDFCSLTTGWIIDKEEYKNGNPLKIKAYFSPLTNGTNKKNVFIRPGGLYVTMYFQGTHYGQHNELRKKILDYIKLNSLTIVGDTYVYPIKNHWQTDNINDYIGKIFVQVEYHPDK